MGSLAHVALALFDSHASLRSWRAAGVRLPAAQHILHPGLDAGLLRTAARAGSALERAVPIPLAARLPSLRSRTRRALGLAPRDFAVTLVGSHLPQKGYDLLLGAVSLLRRSRPELRIELLLIGFADEGAKRAYLQGLPEATRQTLAERRALTVTAALAPYYAASDAFVMNSQGLGENFGRVTIEAMAFGLPVLGTAAGGTPEIVVDGVTGLLHPPGPAGEAALAEHLAALAADRRRARGLGAAGRRRAREHFGGERFCAELGQVLASLREPAP
jgi:glycosyltransferase involved in cell wall biosynthesis